MSSNSVQKPKTVSANRNNHLSSETRSSIPRL